MQSVSSRIWTRVAVFISYDDNHYTTGFLLLSSYVFFLLSAFVLMLVITRMAANKVFIYVIWSLSSEEYQTCFLQLAYTDF